MPSLSACLTRYFPFCFHCFTYSLSSSSARQLVRHLYFIYFHVAYSVIPMSLSFSPLKCASASASSPSALYLTVSLLCLPPISISSSSYSNPIRRFIFGVRCGSLSLATLLFFAVF
ncbi:uncharacterized protein EV420DRAFT_1543593 [Desarmillaria tabescens]|uniref:Uncharacterized protein n=1 Tax=Armillaria tabescens TaxID=1929756 RepID=A0AA39N595_ARMTA|nr:uncharacterized protein EV420DRAFT_1543593 [Desarmillaria tabescens]KAK0458656.1 hypothetical protein EV420DRAFT_1543593 [Desarmillaria tabescens]